MLVVTMPLGGITSGTQAVLAYNFGAGNTDRVKGAQKYIFILAAAYTTSAVYPRTHRRRPVRPSLYIRSDGCR